LQANTCTPWLKGPQLKQLEDITDIATEGVDGITLRKMIELNAFHTIASSTSHRYAENILLWQIALGLLQTSTHLTS